MDKPASGQVVAKEQANKKGADKPTPKDISGQQIKGNSADKVGNVKQKSETTEKNVEKSRETKLTETEKEKSDQRATKSTEMDQKEGEKEISADKKSTGDKKSAKKQGDKKNVEKQSSKKVDNKQTDTKKTGQPSKEAAEIVMEEDVDTDDEPKSYNKLKFHSSKMDLGLRILREEMAHLQDSGNSLSRQIASMYRTFNEMKDTGDNNEECSDDYDQYSNEDDSQCRDYDDLDTEDDVNKMSDLETDSSARSLIESKRKRQQKRPPPIQMQDGQLQSAEKDPNGNRINQGGFSLPVDSEDDRDQAANSDFYPDFETSSSDDCSHCLCCSSLASYSGSGMPWKYVDKSASSAPEYDSDSSEYYSDSDDGPLESPMPIYKRLSPFFYQECYAEVEDEGQLPCGEKVQKQCTGDKDDEESVPEKRMSPLGCESPRPASSRASSGPELDEPDVNDNKIKDKRAKENKTKSPSERSKDSKKKAIKGIPKSEPLVDSKKQLVKSNAAKVTRNAKEEPKSEPINASKPKDKVVPVNSSAAMDDNDEEEEEPVNVKDRIKNFEVQNKQHQPGAFKKNPKPKSPQDQEGEADEVIDKAKEAVLAELRGAIKSPGDKLKVKPSPKPPPVKSKPQKLPKPQNSDKPKYTKSTFEMEIPDEESSHRRKQDKTKRLAGQTIEIPVQYLNNRIPTPHGGQGEYAQPDELTFQVRPVHGRMQGTPQGPFIISTSPTVKRKVSKQVVQLKQPADDISEQTTLRPEPQGGLQTPTPESAAMAGEHHMCPHCHKKTVPPEERKRSVQVLQLQPVDESQLPPPPTPVAPQTPQTTITFEAPPPQQVMRPGRIIKVIPSGRQQMFMQSQPSDEPKSVHFRLNMPVGGQTHGVPIQVGDYIRIPLNRTQARGVRVIFN